MNIFNNYFNNIILFDFITKFKRNSINELPILQKLILSFEYKKPTLRNHKEPKGTPRKTK